MQITQTFGCKKERRKQKDLRQKHFNTHHESVVQKGVMYCSVSFIGSNKKSPWVTQHALCSHWWDTCIYISVYSTEKIRSCRDHRPPMVFMLLSEKENNPINLVGWLVAASCYSAWNRSAVRLTHDLCPTPLTGAGPWNRATSTRAQSFKFNW